MFVFPNFVIPYPCRSSEMEASIRSTFERAVLKLRPRSSVPNFFTGFALHSFKFSVRLCLKNPEIQRRENKKCHLFSPINANYYSTHGPHMVVIASLDVIVSRPPKHHHRRRFGFGEVTNNRQATRDWNVCPKRR